MSKRKLDFESILLRSVPVHISGKEYVLREASTDIFAKYRSAIFARSSLKPAKPNEAPIFQMEGLAEMDAYLLSLCLTEKETGCIVPMAEIIDWPSRITDVLIAELKEMSGMEVRSDEGEADYQEQVKNVPSDATAGSV